MNIGIVDNRYVLIQLSTELDDSRIRTFGMWYVKSFQMCVLKWSPDFSVNVESSIAPVWITLPYLQVHFMNKEVLYSISSGPGKLLKIDDSTNRARFLLEIDMEKTLEENIDWWRKRRILAKNWIWKSTSLCSHCSKIGRKEDLFRVKNLELRRKVQIMEYKVKES